MSTFGEFEGLFKMGKKGPHGPNVTMLAIETFFLASKFNIAFAFGISMLLMRLAGLFKKC